MSLEVNKIHKGDTVETMKGIDDKSVQLVFTSPPYLASIRDDNHKYPGAKDIIKDNQTVEEYIEWSVDIFKQYERLLADDGVVAYNMSYTTFNPMLPYMVIEEVRKQTGFEIADTCVWKKKNCVPLSGHPNRMTRICEFVYIFAKEDRLNDFKANKEVTSTSRTGQKYFKIYNNFIETKNNDGKVVGHDATFSSDLARYFIDLYSGEGDLVLDNFMGTGTTAVAAIGLDRDFIGIDLIDDYIDVANQRIAKMKESKAQISLF